MKPNKITQWCSRLSGPRVGYWTPSDTTSLRKAANNTARVAGVTANDVEILIFNANNLPHGPLPVNGHHEDKAHKFWRSLTYTPKGARRHTKLTSRVNYTADRIVHAYFQWFEQGSDLMAMTADKRPHHAFNGLWDNTSESTHRYWQGLCRSVFPIWRMVVPGVGFIDYVNIPWQQMAYNEHGIASLTVLQAELEGAEK